MSRLVRKVGRITHEIKATLIVSQEYLQKYRELQAAAWNLWQVYFFINSCSFYSCFLHRMLGHLLCIPKMTARFPAIVVCALSIIANRFHMCDFTGFRL